MRLAVALASSPDCVSAESSKMTRNLKYMALAAIKKMVAVVSKVTRARRVARLRLALLMVNQIQPQRLVKA